MFNFLDKIDDYIRSNGIPFKSIEIKSSYLPDYFNYAILCRLRNCHSNYFDMCFPSKYILSYDEYNNLYIKAVSYDRRTTVLIYSQNNYKSGINSNKIGFKISDDFLYREACIIKYNTKRREEVNKILKETYKYRPISERIMTLHKIMDAIYKDCYEKLGNNIYSLVDYSKEMNESTDKIITYIAYLNTCYKEDLLESNKEKMVNINFSPALADQITRRSGTGSYNKERVNEVLPVFDRTNILESFTYQYCCIASSSSSNDIDYYCYLYDTFDDTPILVMEPHSGTKYTRVVYLDKKDYTKEEFALLCKKYLELSNNESFETNRVVRFNHTDIIDFEDNLELVINGSSKSMKKDYNKCKRLAKIKDNL